MGDMASYLFIRDPQSGTMRRIAPCHVPDLFCVREVVTARPGRLAAARAAAAQARERVAQAWRRHRPVLAMALPRVDRLGITR